MIYFPPAFDRFRSEWYGKHLAAMEEPSLYELSARGRTALRFLWLRTFDHPIAVRLQRDATAPKLVAVSLSGEGGYEPGHVVRRIEREIEEADWRRVEAALEAARFDDPDAETALGADVRSGSSSVHGTASTGCSIAGRPISMVRTRPSEMRAKDSSLWQETDSRPAASTDRASRA